MRPRLTPSSADSKRCKDCRQTKDIEKFYSKPSKKGQPYTGTLCSACKSKRYRKGHLEQDSERQKRYRSATPPEVIRSRTSTSARRRAEKAFRRKGEVLATLGKSGCERCGFKDIRALAFHHKDPSAKEGRLTHMLRSLSWERLLGEARKCEVLCMNCHAIEHCVYGPGGG